MLQKKSLNSFYETLRPCYENKNVCILFNAVIGNLVLRFLIKKRKFNVVDSDIIVPTNKGMFL